MDNVIAAARFSNLIAEYLYNLQPDKEMGLPEDIGWHGLYLNDLVGENFDALDPEDQEKLKNAVAAILFEDEDGFIDVALFETMHEADVIWEEVEDDYYEFFDKQDGVSEHAASFSDFSDEPNTQPNLPEFRGGTHDEGQGTVKDNLSPRNEFKVTFADGNTITTGFNGTLEEAERYYVGTPFQFGDTDAHPKDLMVKAISVEQLNKTASCDNCEDCECEDGINKESYTTSAKNEIVKLYSAKPGFPKDEAGIDTLLKGLEKLIPDKIAAGSGKHKVYLVYLCKQLFGLDRPSFVQPEDDSRVKETLEAFEEAFTSQLLPPDKRDLNKFKTLSDMKEFLESMVQEKEEGKMTLATLPESLAVSKNITTPGNPKAEIAAGSKVIASVGDWQIYEVKKNAAGSPQRTAAGWLGANELWDVGWCVGRDRSQDQVNYQTEGDFWFLVKAGRPVYAISSNSYGATIWNPADKPVWETRNARSSSPKNVEAMANQLGVSIGNISSIPPETVDVLSEGVKVSPTLAEVIPAANLSVDFSGLDKVVKAIGVDELIADINAGASSNVASALVTRAIANKKSFSGHWDNFSEEGMIAFINAWAAAGMKNLPPDLEQAFIDDAPNFKF